MAATAALPRALTPAFLLSPGSPPSRSTLLPQTDSRCYTAPPAPFSSSGTPKGPGPSSDTASARAAAAVLSWQEESAGSHAVSAARAAPRSRLIPRGSALPTEGPFAPGRSTQGQAAQPPPPASPALASAGAAAGTSFPPRQLPQPRRRPTRPGAAQGPGAPRSPRGPRAGGKPALPHGRLAAAGAADPGHGTPGCAWAGQGRAGPAPRRG